MQNISAHGLLFSLLVIIFYNAVWVDGADYLKERPSFLKPCHLHGKQDHKCVDTAFENIFTNYKDGVPGLKTLGSLDPFHVKKIRIAQNMGAINVQAELTNVVAHGLSKVKMTNSVIHDKDLTFEFSLHGDSFKLESDYKVKGQLLVLNLDGKGKGEFEAYDIGVALVAKTKLKEVDGQYFIELLSLHTSVNKVGNFHAHLGNLFNGNKELEDSANQLLNDSWRQIFELMRPVFEETLNAVILDRFKKILNYIPASYFIDDLP